MAGDLLDCLLAGLLVQLVFSVLPGWVKDLRSRVLVKLIERVYQTGVRLTQEAMQQLEKRFQRLEGLEKWFVRIEPNTF